MRKILAILALAVAAIFSCGISFAGINDGLVAYYPFDGNANDESGNGNNATEIFGGVSFDNGLTGQGVRFGGYDNPGHIKVPNSATLQFGTNVSFSAWVKVDEQGGMDTYGRYSSSNWFACIFAKDHDRSGLFSHLITSDERGYTEFS